MNYIKVNIVLFKKKNELLSFLKTFWIFIDRIYIAYTYVNDDKEVDYK